MKFIQTLKGNRHQLVRALGRRSFSAVVADSTEAYAKRNYANNVSEYNTVISSITNQHRRHYLLRDVYDDMMLDGVKPERDTFHSLIAGSMKGTRLQDALYFQGEMKAMGLLPDAALYNFLISACGKCDHSDEARRLFEEMKALGVKPSGQTFICLINALAASGRLDQVYAIVRDMTAAGLGLNKYCYAGLITAHMNKRPLAKDTAAKILELIEQSKGWSSVEAKMDSAENVMMGITEEELYNLPTAEYVHRRGGFVIREHTVYHVALHAFAELRDVEAMEKLQEMIKIARINPDVFMVMQTMRCYLHSGDIDNGVTVFQEYMSGRPPVIELYITLIEGAMVGYTPKGMQVALETLTNMNARSFFMTAKMGNELLLKASGEKNGDYMVANMIWDLLQARNVTPSLPAVKAYHNGLQMRQLPADDPRFMHVTQILRNLQIRFGGVGR